MLTVALGITFTDDELRSRAEWCEGHTDIDKPEMRMVRQFGQVCRALVAEREAHQWYADMCKAFEDQLAERDAEIVRLKAKIADAEGSLMAADGRIRQVRTDEIESTNHLRAAIHWIDCALQAFGWSSNEK